ncbi:cAMP receptor protein [Pseudoruegeria aquimaris]|uniref:cAMP receptor protein n=1 Tax=Pseudoruegeria aquimaris TaxID=393663 RepID=A0A1Y5TFB7_9RHOB|nr:Crp/Fnr family transcriptional regulator [Pseudoruegeria aquimaris]SLN62776.1 cAMP receptor protein [Pseudoruegeria aquimaris]
MSATRPFTAKRGQILFQPGQPCPGFVILEEGSIRVTLTGASGRQVVLYRVRPGEVCLQTFSCLINDQTYCAEGVAETDLSGELVPAGAFRARFADDAAFREMVLVSISTRFAEYQQLIEDVALSHFDSRLAKALLRLASEDGFVPATHGELATETASGRAYVSRRLAAFAGEGWVRQREKGIAILSRRELEQVAAGLR